MYNTIIPSCSWTISPGIPEGFLQTKFGSETLSNHTDNAMFPHPNSHRVFLAIQANYKARVEFFLHSMIDVPGCVVQVTETCHHVSRVPAVSPPSERLSLNFVSSKLGRGWATWGKSIFCWSAGAGRGEAGGGGLHVNLINVSSGGELSPPSPPSPPPPLVQYHPTLAIIGRNIYEI